MRWDMKKTKPNVNNPVTKESFKYGCQIVSAEMYQSSIWVTKTDMNRRVTLVSGGSGELEPYPHHTR